MSLDNAIDASNADESTDASLVPAKWGTFVPYGSIENTTEKIHGANFSFFTNGHEIKCARRNGFIAPDEDFYNYQSMLTKYTLQILLLHKLMLSKNLIRGEMIIIYGELFGGKYPHPDITKDVKENLNPIHPIQSGVYYSPKTEFIAFDLFDGVDLLDFDIMEELLNASDIPYLKPLIKDSYENVIKFDPNFTTTIPKLFGYPTPLPPPFNDNMAEGIVIKPVKNIRTSKRRRVILKIKAPNFDERKKNPDKLSKKVKVTSVDKVMMDLSEFININRLNSVISKQNVKVKNDEMKMVELLYEDAMEDFMKDEQLKTKFLKLSDNKKEKVKINGISKANQIVNKHLMSLHNGQ
ncbi:3562_t:CDS:2 [Racocetra fulgida]|uniref:3562_t:CDS:1 n=1 Tax=Racocetra fulgida TaxID=60492 RepID=A0A9N8VXC3_9GLOM|nr:3562_t:CDS:2 [Racocetra fulgida]